MANAYTINDHSLVINVRSGFLTYGRAIGRFAHACREKNQTEHIKYLNKNPTTLNRYKLLSEFNGNGNMRDANSKDDELHNMAFVKNLLKGFQDSFKEDYGKQSYTQKRQGKDIVIRRTWRKDMASFCEVIITFGTDREKEPKEGLNDEESKFINENIQMDRVMRFINAYCAKHGVKCLLVAEHNDEKTKHYHIIFINYNFEKHANLRFSGRSKTAKFGKELQDMGAEAFEGQVLRGKSSKNRHKNLTKMHQIAREYKSEQELKESQAKQDNEITILRYKLKAHTNQQTKIDEQSALIKSKVRENQSLTRKAESLQSKNTELRYLNDKSLGLLLEIASTDPELKEMIVNEMPELRGKFIKDDVGMEMGVEKFSRDIQSIAVI